MSAARGLGGYPGSLAAIIAFSLLLGLAFIRLSETEEAVRNEIGDNLLWVISQGQIEALRLRIEFSRARNAGQSTPELAKAYDILLSRLVIAEEGPQRRYLERIGQFDDIRRISEAVRDREAAILDAPLLSADEAERVHQLLAELASHFGRAANEAMVDQWDEAGQRLDQRHAAINQILFLVLAIVVLGAFISLRMILALRAEQESRTTLLREQEVRQAYRDFVALVSHQFRTPLSIIDSSMQRLIRQAGSMDENEVIERARKSRTTIRRLTALIDGILNSMKLDAGQIEVDPRDVDVVREVEAAIARHMEAHPDRRIEIDVDDEVPREIEIDPLLLIEIVDNLLSNALKYSPAGSLVTVNVHRSADDLVIEVADEGIGIARSEQARVFERFFRSEASRSLEGVGMGLHLSKGIAELLGGSLDYRERRPRGSVFRLKIPIGTNPHRAAPSIPPASAEIERLPRHGA